MSALILHATLFHVLYLKPVLTDPCTNKCSFCYFKLEFNGYII